MPSTLVRATIVVALVTAAGTLHAIQESRTTSGPILTTTNGQVRGLTEGNTNAFRGIPYATAGRWRRPVLFTSKWDGVRDGTERTEPCSTFEFNFNREVWGPYSGRPIGKEDCLTLNVWLPRNPPATPLPVVVFANRGGNVATWAERKPWGTPITGNYWVEHEGVIFVSPNSRTSIFAHLTLPQLDKEDPDGASGMYGSLDIVEALRWVRTNAASMGADPSRVLVIGESAGVANLTKLMFFPGAKGLFSALAMLSGPPAINIAITKDRQADYNSGLVSAVGCAAAADVLACLRALPADTLQRAVADSTTRTGRDGFAQLLIDGYMLRDHPSKLIAQNAFNKAPLIVSSCQYEYYPHGQTPGSVATETAYEAKVAAFVVQKPPSATAPVGNRAAEVVARYPSSKYGGPDTAWASVQSDALRICGLRRLVRTLSATEGQPPIYTYVFKRGLDVGAAPTVGLVKSVGVKHIGAFHSLDEIFLLHNFDNQSFIGPYKPTSDEWALSERMIHYFAQFVKNGNPNGEGAPEWRPYSAATDEYLSLDVKTEMANDYTATCTFWESF